jgi:hypothetical protein
MIPNVMVNVTKRNPAQGGCKMLALVKRRNKLASLKLGAFSKLAVLEPMRYDA